MIRSIDELPTKRPTDKKFERLEVVEFLKMKKELKTPFGWGSQCNNPCEIYETPDGREIEAYGIKNHGYVISAFIEVKQ